ncbi:MAG: hypothetical protein OJF51_001679 [Nitrospira sp.]|nr:MAG: hypothetical protein OJF51_001679 [Nitrospira sp.]
MASFEGTDTAIHFPSRRRIGWLKTGYEASVLILTENPSTASNGRGIARRVKQGQRLANGE